MGVSTGVQLSERVLATLIQYYSPVSQCIAALLEYPIGLSICPPTL